jgi:hypothetical protein
MGRALNLSQFQHNVTDGTTTVATTYVTNGSAKAWINLNGQGTIEARDSFNVASLTDNGTSSYKVNVTNDFSSIDHAPTVSGSTFNGRNHVLATDSRTFNTSDISITASSWTIGSADFGASSYNADTKYLMSNSHGDLA